MIIKESVGQLTFIISFSEQCLEQYDKIINFQKYIIFLKDLHMLYYKCTESYFYTKYFSCLQKLPSNSYKIGHQQNLQ